MPTYIKKTCQHCGEEYTVLPRKKKQKYCSPDCAKAYSKEHAKYKKESHCLGCGKELANGPFKFCSQSCAAKYNNLRRSNESREKQKTSLAATLKAKGFDLKESRELLPRVNVVKDNTTLVSYQDIFDITYCVWMIESLKDPTIKITDIATDKILRKHIEQLCLCCGRLRHDCDSELCDKFCILKSIKKWFHLDLKALMGSMAYIHEFQKLIDKLNAEYEQSNTVEMAAVHNYTGHHRNFYKILKSIGINVLTLKQSSVKYHTKAGTYDRKSEREIYYLRSAFHFRITPNIEGHELIEQLGWYDSETNPNGVVRDHMFSRIAGFRQNIPPEIIGHPANCRILPAIDNIRKSSHCDLSLEELKERIKDWDAGIHPSLKTPLKEYKHIGRPISEEQKEAVRKYNLGRRKITNGIINKTIAKDEPLPDGFRFGMTRKKKMIAALMPQS